MQFGDASRPTGPQFGVVNAELAVIEWELEPAGLALKASSVVGQLIAFCAEVGRRLLLADLQSS